MRLVCSALILLLNLHEIRGNVISDLYRRLTGGLPASQGGSSGEIDNAISRYAISFKDVAKENGYPSESHEVTTEDGYILTVHRIPGRPGAPPIFLQHGLLESSTDWLISGKGKSLAFILADQGYDVWLGNARGNTYSKKHKTLSPSDPRFWNFSWTELGQYDLPAVLTYVANQTNDRLFYVGHSMGSWTFSLMASERPDVARKIKAMIGLAPANYVFHSVAPMRMLSPFWREILQFLKMIGIHEIFPRGRFFDGFSQYICKSGMFGDAVCSSILLIIAGYGSEQLDYALLPQIWKTFPAGASATMFAHWLQQMRTNKYRKFDHGPEGNLRIYNSTEPPVVDVSKVRVPIALFWSANDWLVGEQDVKQFYDQVPVKLGIYKVEDEKFNHFDFLWGLQAPDILYPKMLNLLSDFSNQIIRN